MSTKDYKLPTDSHRLTSMGTSSASAAPMRINKRYKVLWGPFPAVLPVMACDTKYRYLYGKGNLSTSAQHLHIVIGQVGSAFCRVPLLIRTTCSEC